MKGGHFSLSNNNWKADAKSPEIRTKKPKQQANSPKKQKPSEKLNILETEDKTEKKIDMPQYDSEEIATLRSLPRSQLIAEYNSILQEHDSLIQLLTSVIHDDMVKLNFQPPSL